MHLKGTIIATERNYEGATVTVQCWVDAYRTVEVEIPLEHAELIPQFEFGFKVKLSLEPDDD